MAEARRGDRGETLIEILISLVIMGLAMTALLTGLAAASRTAGLHRDEADANTYVVQLAEQLKAVTYDTTCAASPYSLTGVVPGAWPAPTATVKYWDAAAGTFTGSCLDGNTALASYRKMQQVTIKVTAPSGIFDSIVLVKRYQS
ncbi:MAG: hypothetical protein QOJ79_3371 [Actinomycetota bacterium]|jgi:type II secretory pathway pseudopilin PulG|nr:hypothetical protein [Actinomycetota bacterium]